MVRIIFRIHFALGPIPPKGVAGAEIYDGKSGVKIFFQRTLLPNMLTSLNPARAGGLGACATTPPSTT